MMIHLKNTLVADRTMMCSRWLWLDAFLADSGIRPPCGGLPAGTVTPI